MLLFVTTLHVVLCFVLILIIIIQPGKGGDVASAFGGGGAQSTVFGPRGGASLLSRATTVVAVLFMCTSITLAMYSDESMVSSGSIEDQLLLQEEDHSTLEATPGDAGTEEAATLPWEEESTADDPARDGALPPVEPDTPASEGTEESP